MSSAALQVEVLEKIMQENIPEKHLAKAFFKEAKK
jgi:hypothetical protein